MAATPQLRPGAHAVITGGSSGIGLATAFAFAARGVNVSLLARRPEVLESAAGRLAHSGVQVVTVAVDVADAAAVEHAFDEAVTGLGPVDVLVTCAGQARPGYFQDLEPSIFRSLMEVNYFGTLHAVRAVAPSMIERRRGSIVGVSSAAGLIGVFGYTAYGPTKFAVRGLFEALRAELRPYDVHVGCVFPPDVDTPQLEDEDRYKPAETRAISGAIKPISADAVATAIVSGIDRRRFSIIPDVQTRLLARIGGLVAGTLASSFDRKVARARSRSQQPDG